MKQKVQLLSLDFGSTTSCAMVVEAIVEKSSVSEKMTLNKSRTLYKSKPVFTPVVDSVIDEQAITHLIEQWLQESNVDRSLMFSGGAIFTGLTAQSENVKDITKVVQRYIGKGMINTVDDPNLESWLAYRGNVSSSNLQHQPVLNLDIGGGTTNVANGVGGSVFSTGCYFIGARHFQFIPGTYQLIYLSPSAIETLEYLQLVYQVGDTIKDKDIKTITSFYICQLKNIKNNRTVCSHLVQVDINTADVKDISDTNEEVLNSLILLSGGVGELYYEYLRTKELPSKTFFGDLGIDLVTEIISSDLLDPSVCLPEDSGRATAYGMALFNTDLSGMTVYLSDPSVLPVADVPIVGEISFDDLMSSAITGINNRLISIINTQVNIGGAVFLKTNASTLIDKSDPSMISILRDCCDYLRVLLKNSIERSSKTNTEVKPLFFFVDSDVALTLGNYLSQWRQWDIPLIILDDVPHKAAAFVNVGKFNKQVVPVSFYGLHQFNS